MASGRPAAAPPGYGATNQPSIAGSSLLSAPNTPISLPGAEPVTLSWSGESDANLPRSLWASTSVLSEPASTGAPPGYQSSRKPTETLVYSFSRLSNHEMLLLPPSSHPDSRPVYHISVDLNCFMPNSYITTIRRGGSSDGEFVADFELGLSWIADTLVFRGKKYALNNVFSFTSKLLGPPTYNWHILPNTAKWRGNSVTGSSYSPHLTTMKRTYTDTRKPGHGVKLAVLNTSPLLRLGNCRSLPQLTVYPEGQDVFDEIVLSTLIMERKRLVFRVNGEPQ